MADFEFVSPTKIFFGKKKEEDIASILSSYGLRHPMLVYGSSSIKRSGLYDLVATKLKEAGISFCELSGVRPNPSSELVKSGVNLAKEEDIDCLLAIGGGSVIDTAKSIGVGFYYDGDPFDFNLHIAEAKKSLPVGVILTIASAGSEASNSCVIQNDVTKVKQGFNNDLVRPLFAIEDPELTSSVPPFQTACGIADTMMHSLERYFSFDPVHQLSDDWALDLVKDVMVNGKKALENPNDYDARAALMLDSTLSHNGLTGLAKRVKFVVHPLEHALSGYKKDVTHGAGVALLYSAWARYVYERNPAPFAYLANKLFNIKGASEQESAIMGIVSMEDFFASIGMPTSLNEVGIRKEDIPNLVALASGNGTRVVGCYPQPLEAKDMEAIYASLVH